MRIRAVLIGSWLVTKCRARWMPNCSADSMPCSFAKANTVFLVVSVGSTWALEPDRCTSSMSPDRATETLRSLMWWVPPSRVILTTRFSALPYWFWPRIVGMCLLAPSVYGVAERVEQQRYVVVLARGDGESDRHLGEERAAVPYAGGVLL